MVTSKRFYYYREGVSMQSLAVKYRPTKFEDCVEQSIIIKILNNQILNNSIGNAYLFSGFSGCGKTTVARIFANLINKGVGEPIEIDAASNNGVDNVKEIVKNASERAIDGEYKIYIIDEAHSLTNQAWQAFLKCIEETPKYTVFIFCTTEIQKIPLTILNRVQKFNFSQISTKGIMDRLCYICDNENYQNYQSTCDYISKTCNGSMRNAIAMLQKVASYNHVMNLDDTLNILGTYSYDDFFNILNCLIDGDEQKVLSYLHNIYDRNNNVKTFVDDFFDFVLDIVKYNLFNSCSNIKIPSTMENKIRSCLNFQNPNNYYNYIIDRIVELRTMLKQDTQPKNTVEYMFLRIARCN